MEWWSGKGSQRMNAQMLTADGLALFLTAFVDLIPNPSAKIGREASSNFQTTHRNNACSTQMHLLPGKTCCLLWCFLSVRFSFLSPFHFPLAFSFQLKLLLRWPQHIIVNHSQAPFQNVGPNAPWPKAMLPKNKKLKRRQIKGSMLLLVLTFPFRRFSENHQVTWKRREPQLLLQQLLPRLYQKNKKWNKWTKMTYSKTKLVWRKERWQMFLVECVQQILRVLKIFNWEVRPLQTFLGEIFAVVAFAWSGFKMERSK